MVLSGSSLESAAGIVGVSTSSLQAKMEQTESAASTKKSKLQRLLLARFSDEDLVRWGELLESGVREGDAMATLCPYPQLITEEEANTRFDTKSKLSSKGNYGCHVLVVRPEDLTSDSGYWMCDDQFSRLREFDGGYDVGTVIVDGDVTLQGEASISDRLMCLVVAGSFSAPQLHVFETEVSIYGDLKLELLTDHDDLVSVLGHRDVEEVATYEDS